jgi:hypothetical protein
MHYTILVWSCPYICFDTPCAILRGVVESSQFSNYIFIVTDRLGERGSIVSMVTLILFPTSPRQPLGDFLIKRDRGLFPRG